MECRADMGTNDVKFGTAESEVYSAVLIWVPRVLKSAQLKEKHRVQS
jgi:hypothetical protein